MAPTQPSSADPSSRVVHELHTRWPERLTASAQRELILVLLLILCYGFFRQVPFWNENTRYDLVLALVDDRTTIIDRYHENTGDKVFYEGHYYSDKPPGSSLLGVPVYGLMRVASGPMGSAALHHEVVMHALAFTVSGIPTMLVSLLLLRFLKAVVDEWWALAITIGYALGSLAFPFATMYFGHAASTFFLFAAFYLLWRFKKAKGDWRLAAAGALAGWAVLTELPAVLGFVILFIYAFSLSGRGSLLFVTCGLPALGVLLAYNWISFAHPFAVAHHYHALFSEQHKSGLVGVSWPALSAVIDLLIAPRGLFSLSPWLALAPLGLFAARPGSRAELTVCATIISVYLLYNSGFWNPLGGASPGPRYLVSALPFAAVLVALAPRAFRPLAGALIGFSLVIAVAATATMPNALEGVSDPLRDLWLPRVLSGNLADTTAWRHWGLPGAQPLLVLAIGASLSVAAVYATTRPTVIARWLASGGTGLLAALVVLFGTPVDLRALPLGARADDREVQVAIVHTGLTATPERRGGAPTVIPWAQLENRGGRTGETMVVFSIYTASGQRVWAGWHGRVRWQARERKKLAVEWSPAGVAPGDYRLGVAVTGADRQLNLDEQEVFTSFDHAGWIRVAP
jgi:hypothetical protein